MVMNAPPAVSPEQAEAFVARRLSLRHLRVLLAVADGGSVSAAAELLHVTQPAVSKALAELEQELGQTLFARRGRSFRATAVGERLLLLARKLEADLRRGSEDIASMVRGASGALLIGATNAVLAEVLPNALVAMKADYPQVTLSVRTHALRDLFAELRAGRLDMVIARTPEPEEPTDLEGHSLGEIPEVVIMSLNHPLAKARRVSWEQLRDQTWIWQLPGTRSRALLDRMWQNIGLPPPTQLIELGDVMLAMELMRRMPLVNIVPLHVARLATRRGIAKILPLPVDIRLSSLMVWHLPEPQGEAVQHFKMLLDRAAIDAAQAGD
ncbi:LysR substrate-binding domain-containing protein [Pelomonas sp. CA6]|uniref:LysR family transcriptional regulator n=1 Tax=Pelomonas sp. CA6 TaxID=2907999 RepID=UPI001F4B23A7|nr:LysR substrate-binding domain-containing protein [Pelomonas sp. CA6]MCH7342484.1 LysR substrate-binding domain-containing protein [Pelomonas sp. CA6]